MLLLHQVGSVKIGELVRYTVTYTPSQDRILPSPKLLHLRIRNTSAIALRAAFVHGPYTLAVAAYPAHFNPNEKFTDAATHGVPEYEPMLKAGGSWSCHLVVPDTIRQSAGVGGGFFGGDPVGSVQSGMSEKSPSATWIIEVSSQVIFSTSASVGYEIMLGRDEKSLHGPSNSGLSLGGGAVSPTAEPGKISDHQQSVGAKNHPAQPKGVFSGAISVRVDDTASIWNTPPLPEWDEADGQNQEAQGKVVGTSEQSNMKNEAEEQAETHGPGGMAGRQKKVHLVVLTHGLHGNLTADMLYLKESIDAGVRKAKIDARARKQREREQRKEDLEGSNGSSMSRSVIDESEEDADDEEVIVRGFSGNATHTERGIEYLGKRLAKFLLRMTYPDQPYLPLKGGKPPVLKTKRAFKIVKISFIGHSLGGLVQTYAVAYIQRSSSSFFDIIKPVNFVALASPMLGLSNENPLYVKFALDFGLVGRTGQDLGLTWRAPTIARSGWSTLVGQLGDAGSKKKFKMGESRPESKPLLRILPTGPAHTALAKFRNRTVYSNVVNDGIVPLRTSCLLFLDWQGLGRVEKARREAGLVGSLVGFGWAELTGANSTTARTARWKPTTEDQTQSTPQVIAAGASGSTDDAEDTDAGYVSPRGHDHSHEVPQPSHEELRDDDKISMRSFSTATANDHAATGTSRFIPSSDTGPLAGLLSLFHKDPSSTHGSKSNTIISPKANMIYQRSQTLSIDSDENSSTDEVGRTKTASQAQVTSGHELGEDTMGAAAPPKTSFFESAGDLLNPRLPTVDFIIDPAKRGRTIFHDRVYHPTDIPPPPLKKRPTRCRSVTRTDSLADSAHDGHVKGLEHQDSWKDYLDPSQLPSHYSTSDAHALTANIVDSSHMKVEEKIARAYHKGLSWRKVLVKLEPDAHNNIIVRRTFANAFGWPVIKHLVDAHFSDEPVTRVADQDLANVERAQPLTFGPAEDGKETVGSESGEGKQAKARDGNSMSFTPLDPGDSLQRTTSEKREAEDSVGSLQRPSLGKPRYSRSFSSTTPSGPSQLYLHMATQGSGLTLPKPPPQAQVRVKSPGLPPGTTAPGLVPLQTRGTTVPTTAIHIHSASGTVTRPTLQSLQRRDSISWSDGDWASSGEDGDDDNDEDDDDNRNHGHAPKHSQGEVVPASGSGVPATTATAATAPNLPGTSTSSSTSMRSPAAQQEWFARIGQAQGQSHRDFLAQLISGTGLTALRRSGSTPPSPTTALRPAPPSSLQVSSASPMSGRATNAPGDICSPTAAAGGIGGAGEEVGGSERSSKELTVPPRKSAERATSPLLAAALEGLGFGGNAATSSGAGNANNGGSGSSNGGSAWNWTEKIVGKRGGGAGGGGGASGSNQSR